MDEDTNGGDFKLDLDLDTLNLTSEEIDFDEIDDDLERFQEDEMVKAALQRGVDLRKYGQELETQLKEVTSSLCVNNEDLFRQKRLLSNSIWRTVVP